jgi:hypothetical protein
MVGEALEFRGRSFAFELVLEGFHAVCRGGLPVWNVQKRVIFGRHRLVDKATRGLAAVAQMPVMAA